MADEESVKVAVRLRPFNKRENDALSAPVVTMWDELEGSKTRMRHPDTNEVRDFNLDYSFQSSDPRQEGFVTQDGVYAAVGVPVLKMALEGVNVCLFAYGQTGAGKSYSMLGKHDPASEQGIIPRVCRALIEKINDENLSVEDTVKSTINIQVVEVYCEQINDLLTPRNKWPQHGHKPRLSKDGYVVDTMIRPCKSFEEIEAAFVFSDLNRSVGSHLLNQESSRAHTIYTINYERRTRLTAVTEEVVSTRINLVDLAGSERCDATGTSGQMLKEGTMINRSLSTLGNVIRALSESKKPNFRESKLTLLLQGSMINGRLLMIAALSPASICYEETLSTLRFAERIKKVKIKAKKNVTTDAVAEVRKEMEAMRVKMMEEIAYWKSIASTQAGKDEADVMLSEGIADLDRELEKQALGKSESPRSNQDLEWAQAFGIDPRSKDNLLVPHLLNMNEDMRLSETLVYPFVDEVTVIGKASKTSPPHHEFNGIGMQTDHCTVEYVKDAIPPAVWIVPGHIGGAIYLNGVHVKERTQIVHNCRLWLGSNYAFRFAFPGQEALGFSDAGDYLMAEAEIAAAAGLNPSAGGRSEAMTRLVSEALRRVEQANVIAADLEYRVTFEAKLFKDRKTKKDIVVVGFKSPSVSLLWPYEKFLARQAAMAEMWQDWRTCDLRGGPAYQHTTTDDNPFVDDEYQLIGEADVWLRSLGNMIETDMIATDSPAAVVSLAGEAIGALLVDIMPLDTDGGRGPWESKPELDPFVEKPEMLLGTTIQFEVSVLGLRFDAEFVQYEDTWVRYRVTDGEDSEWVTTSHVAKCVARPMYNMSHTHMVTVNKEFVAKLTNGSVTFQVWGKHRRRRSVVDLKAEGGGAERGGTLPEGWKKITAYLDPEGVIHAEPPGVGGSRPKTPTRPTSESPSAQTGESASRDLQQHVTPKKLQGDLASGESASGDFPSPPRRLDGTQRFSSNGSMGKKW